MKLMARYLTREIAGGIMAVLLGFLGLFAFFDLINELDDIGQGGYRLPQAVLYVLLGLPSHIYELMPVAALIGCIYALAQFAQNSEFTAMRAAGMSRQLALRGVLVLGVLLAVLTAAGIRPNKAKTNQLADAIKQIFSGAVVNNLTSADADKPLSAAMGKKLAEQSVVYQSWATEQIAGKANKSSTRAGYGITDASEVAVLTGQLNHGSTIPLPPGYREDQCKWLVSMAEDDPNYTSWDISEGGLSKHYYYRCYTRGRTVTAQVYHGSSDQNPNSNYQGWLPGKVNYICIGIK